MPQPTAYYPDGTPIPEEEWDNVVASGQAQWTGGQLKAITPDGERRVIDAAEYQRAIAAGWRIAKPSEVAHAERMREAGTLGQAAIAGLEGAARGLTLGGSDLLLRDALGREWAERASARREANPTASTAGEIAGAVAPIIVSGGTGAVATGARAVGAAPLAAARAGAAVERAAANLLGASTRGTLGRIGARAASGAAGAAAEGALYGVGQAITDHALNDAELTAEKILSSAGSGALWGGLAGGAFGALAGTAGAVRQSFGRAAQETPIRQQLREFAEQRAFKQVTGNNKRLFEEAQKYGGMERVRRIGRKLLDRKIPIADLDEAAKAVQKQLDGSGAQLRRVAKRLDDAGVTVDGRELLYRVDDQIRRFQESSLGDFSKIAKKLEKQIEPLRKKIEGTTFTGIGPSPAPVERFSFSDFWELRRQLDDTVNWAARKQSPATDAMRDLRRTFEDLLMETIESAQGKGSDDLLRLWKNAKQDYSDFILVKEGLEDQITRRESNRFFSPTDYYTAGGAGQLSGLGAGLATGSLTVGALTGAATSFAGSLVHKTMREQGSAIAAQIADRLSRFDGRFETAAQLLAGVRKAQISRTVAPTTVPLLQRFEETRQTIERFRDPQQAATILAQATADISTSRPDIAEAVQERMLGDVAHLEESLPPALTRAAHSLTPQAEAARVPPSAARIFMRKVRALEDPMSVVEDLAAGKLDREAIETLKVRRPKLFAALREQIMVYTAQRHEALPYKQRVLLSLAFDFAGDRSLEPATLARIQETYAATEQPSAPPQGGGNINPRIADETVTPAQQALGGR